MLFKDLLENRYARFDDRQKSDGLVNFNHLPGETGPEVRGMTVHHTDETADIMRELRSAPVATRINEAEIIFKVDTRSNWPNRKQKRRE